MAISTHSIPELAAALSYGAQGWKVFPLATIADGKCTCYKGASCGRSSGKHPLNEGWQETATSDSVKIQRWLSRRPTPNIGIATGTPSGFFVLDVDGDEGAAEIKRQEKTHGPLPRTVESITGSGGRHLLFRLPDFEVPNRTKFLPGLDIRGNGGLIVAPPSIHLSGNRYAWHVSPEEAPIAPAPAWLLQELRKHLKTTRGIRNTQWRNLVREGVEEGGRNDTIARLSGKLLGGGPLDVYAALQLILAFNEARCHPPLPEDEVLRTFNSVAGRELDRRRRAGHGR